MNNFTAKRKVKTRRQINLAVPSKIFSLLCPVREADWIDGWEYKLIYSVSGLGEAGCIFTTPSGSNGMFTWYVTYYDTKKFEVEFVRMAESEMVVKINIWLTDNKNGTTTSDIAYEYTSLSLESNNWLENELDNAFEETMAYWEKAINHYLQTGTKLINTP